MSPDTHQFSVVGDRPMIQIEPQVNHLYELKMKHDMVLTNYQTKIIRTGIKANVEHDELFLVGNRWSNHLKHSCIKSTSVDLIDHEYCNQNGEIVLRLTYENEFAQPHDVCIIHAGQLIAQGQFISYDSVQLPSKGGVTWYN